MGHLRRDLGIVAGRLLGRRRRAQRAGGCRPCRSRRLLHRFGSLPGGRPRLSLGPRVGLGGGIAVGTDFAHGAGLTLGTAVRLRTYGAHGRLFALHRALGPGLTLDARLTLGAGFGFCAHFGRRMRLTLDPERSLARFRTRFGGASRPLASGCFGVGGSHGYGSRGKGLRGRRRALAADRLLTDGGFAQRRLRASDHEVGLDLAGCLLGPDSALDHEVLGTTDHHEVLYIVAADQHQAAALVDNRGLENRDSLAATAADATARPESLVQPCQQADQGEDESKCQYVLKILDNFHFRCPRSAALVLRSGR